MKKRGHIRREDNIIIFPELEKRLTEKGLDSLQKKKFSDAVRYFEDAREMDPKNPDTLIGLVLAYFENGTLKDAKELANSMLREGIGDYFQMVDLYIMILIQLHEYEEVVQTIEALLEEREIPSDKAEHFLTILQFSKKMSDNRPHQEKDELQKKIQEEGKLEPFNLFAYQDPKEQMLLVAKMANQNIRPYIHDIKAYLISDSGHPFLKTMLLNLLKDQEYDREVEVTKLGILKKMIPSELPDIHNQEIQKEISASLRERIEQDDPVLFENINSLIERHFFLLYPFELTPDNTDAWAAAYHLIGGEYHGIFMDSSEMCDLYSVSEQEMKAAEIRIREIEEISYPII